jgi:hypothetical protein
MKTNKLLKHVFFLPDKLLHGSQSLNTGLLLIYYILKKKKISVVKVPNATNLGSTQDSHRVF